jgi:enoyl-CoA hydratase
VDYQTIVVRQEDGIGFLTLNRPEVLNAINRTLMAETTHAMDGFAAAPEVAAVVVNGAGRAFSAGFDMKESATRKTTEIDQWQQVLRADFDFIMQFFDCPKPTIAAVHGYCLAGAFELALACDITVAAAGTRFGEPEARFGSGIICLLLPWVAGPKAAKELLLTGDDRVSAERALALGVVNHVVPDGSELDRAVAIAQDIRAAAPRSVQLTKRALNRTLEAMGLRTALLTGLDYDVLIEAGAGPERNEFNRLRREEGLKAAIAWRDARFRKTADE